MAQPEVLPSTAVSRRSHCWMDQARPEWRYSNHCCNCNGQEWTAATEIRPRFSWRDRQRPLATAMGRIRKPQVVSSNLTVGSRIRPWQIIRSPFYGEAIIQLGKNL